MNLSAIVLAGGYGAFTGMCGAKTSKVAAKLNGQPMLRHILETLRSTRLFNDYHVVTNTLYERQIRSIVQGIPNVTFSIQQHRLGTAGAVALALERLPHYSQHALITYGDMPLWQAETFSHLASEHMRNMPVLTLATIPLKPGTKVERYGRVIYGPEGECLGTIDDPNFVPQGKFVQAEKVNPSLYVANVHWLRSVIPEIPAYDKGDGFPPEQLMQSVIPLAYQSGNRVVEVYVEDYEQALGVNTKAELREVRKVYAERYAPQYAYLAA